MLAADSGLGFLPGLDEGELDYGLFVGLMRPASRGTVRLSGPEATDRLLIDPNYFGNDRDMRTSSKDSEWLAESDRRARWTAGEGQRWHRETGSSTTTAFVRS